MRYLICFLLVFAILVGLTGFWYGHFDLTLWMPKHKGQCIAGAIIATILYAFAEEN